MQILVMGVSGGGRGGEGLLVSLAVDVVIFQYGRVTRILGLLL